MSPLSANEKKAFCDIFNTKAEEFMKELVTSFPEVKQFVTIKSGFSLLKNLDPKKPQEVFNNLVYNKYKDRIMIKDEEFFLYTNFNIKEHTDYWEEFIDNIGGIWKTLDNENKEIVWKYFHVLIVINEKCIS